MKLLYSDSCHNDSVVQYSRPKRTKTYQNINGNFVCDMDGIIGKKIKKKGAELFNNGI